MVNYEAQLRAVKRELRKVRDDAKKKKQTPFDLFYFETAAILRQQFHVQVSAGWVREQCTKNTDPSYLRVGALMNFLEQYHGVKVNVEEATRVADHGPRVEEDSQEERDKALFERFKAEAEAKKAKGKPREPNAWMKQIEAQKRAARAKSS